MVEKITITPSVITSEEELELNTHPNFLYAYCKQRLTGLTGLTDTIEIQQVRTDLYHRLDYLARLLGKAK